MKEVALIFDTDYNVIEYHVPDNPSPGYIHQSERLFFSMWDNKHRFKGIAHTHPGGFCLPSSIDLETFITLDGLFVDPEFAIVTEDKITWWRMDGTIIRPIEDRPLKGLEELRRLSYGERDA